jgi:glycosyltransferase involved in cell wall biosynthesis
MPSEQLHAPDGLRTQRRAQRHPPRLRVLTWHVHGNYLYYLSQAPHDFYLVTKPGSPPGYAGRVGSLPWGDNVYEIAHDAVRTGRFDCVLFQSRQHWENDREAILSAEQRRLPAIYLEHDPPQQHPSDSRHWVQERNVLLVHVTPFNALMWDSGSTPAIVIEHGVVLPAFARYTGELERGIVVVNHLKRRGRRLGADIFIAARERLPLDLVGMDAQALGGLGEIGNLDLARFMAPYRFFFNPIRWTSLGLAVVEAMTIGMPIVGLATTELAAVIERGVNGYVDTDLDRLVETMHTLLRNPALARRWGEAAQRTARERFHIERFVRDWNQALTQVTSA